VGGKVAVGGGKVAVAVGGGRVAVAVGVSLGAAVHVGDAVSEGVDVPVGAAVQVGDAVAESGAAGGASGWQALAKRASNAASRQSAKDWRARDWRANLGRATQWVFGEGPAMARSVSCGSMG